MTDTNKPVARHLVSARERLAGVKAAQKWRQDLAAQHLLDTQRPIKDQPAEPETEKGT
jgi:hypothetical protein